ncbi:hypothetical protein ES703_98978 [subsurface metagenome]
MRGLLLRRALRRDLIGAEPDEKADSKQRHVKKNQADRIPVGQYRAVQFHDLSREKEKQGKNKADRRYPFRVAQQREQLPYWNRQFAFLE